jgi:hypothetical protein
MTMLKKLPTTAMPTRMMMTGIRIAHTLGGKKLCSSMFSSTKGYNSTVSAQISVTRLDEVYHEQRPDGVIKEHDGGGYDHGESGKFGEL